MYCRRHDRSGLAALGCYQNTIARYTPVLGAAWSQQSLTLAPTLVYVCPVQDGVKGALPLYRGTLHAARSIIQEEGCLALYAGRLHDHAGCKGSSKTSIKTAHFQNSRSYTGISRRRRGLGSVLLCIQCS